MPPPDRWVFDVTRREENKSTGEVFWKKVGIAFISPSTQGKNKGKLQGRLHLNMFSDDYHMFERVPDESV